MTKQCRKKVCPFLLLENSILLSPPWGPQTSDQPTQELTLSSSYLSIHSTPGLFCRTMWPHETPLVFLEVVPFQNKHMMERTNRPASLLYAFHMLPGVILLTICFKSCFCTSLVQKPDFPDLTDH